MPTLTIQPSGADSELRNNEAANNYGSSAEFKVRGGAIIYRAPLKFDFSALPARTTITGATLSIYFFEVHAGLDAVGRTYEANRITQIGWTEGSGGINDVSWNKYTTGNAWASGGGDFTTTNQATAVVPVVGNWIDFDVKDQVIYAHNSVSDIAHFLIKDQTEGGTDKSSKFYSNDEVTNLTLRPKLVIEYILISSISTALPTGLYSGVKEKHPKDGWENEKNFFVEQSSPHPCIVQYWDLFVDTTNE
ncbi:hypothetical protein LCGC14_0820390 [marine sediment metagenome]|uniref:Carbohydrate-binding module family 96 domain-containing protein n=1 Tax=marine sediment metagenome TaxID=412755 RepID=A0A0F9S3Z4_9ZZZZ